MSLFTKDDIDLGQFTNSAGDTCTILSINPQMELVSIRNDNNDFINVLSFSAVIEAFNYGIWHNWQPYYTTDYDLGEIG